MLINLIKNALKFTRGGSVRVFAAFDGHDDQLKVHVVDTGAGIRQDELQLLFSRFGKMERTASQNEEGIGLGLVICQ